MRKLRLLVVAAFGAFGLSAPAYAGDVAVTAANVVASSTAKPSTGKCGEAITAGQVVYLDSTSGELHRASSNGAGTSKADGIALNNCSAGQPISYAPSDQEFSPGFLVTPGEIYVVSATAGSIAPAVDLVSGKYTTVIGVGKTTSQMSLRITAAGVAKP